MRTSQVSSWGNLSCDYHRWVNFENKKNLFPPFKKNLKGLVYGNGRSYGDVCLNPLGFLWDTTSLNHFIDFDINTGILTCESGVLIKDIQETFIPKGWMISVTPGTQMLTIGGAIANDIHGKNHHLAGSFGNHVIEIYLLRSNGEEINCSQTNNSNMFFATIGGLGLTGIIVQVKIQLKRIKSAWLNTETLPFNGLDDFLNISVDSHTRSEFSISWVNLSKRNEISGFFMSANLCDDGDKNLIKKKTFPIPIKPEFSLINPVTVKAFNSIFDKLNKLKNRSRREYYEDYFYPLDSVLNWNRLYGAKGFYQYQCVIPKKDECYGIKAIFDEIFSSRQGSFLTSLKTFGKIEALGMLSFPLEGTTLALDFPNKGVETLKLFDRLNHVVKETGGKIYLAKDACMNSVMFKHIYPKYIDFVQYRDPNISSQLSKRLMGY